MSANAVLNKQSYKRLYQQWYEKAWAPKRWGINHILGIPIRQTANEQTFVQIAHTGTRGLEVKNFIMRWNRYIMPLTVLLVLALAFLIIWWTTAITPMMMWEWLRAAADKDPVPPQPGKARSHCPPAMRARYAWLPPWVLIFC